jgi:hypothetical protein
LRSLTALAPALLLVAACGDVSAEQRADGGPTTDAATPRDGSRRLDAGRSRDARLSDAPTDRATEDAGRHMDAAPRIDATTPRDATKEDAALTADAHGVDTGCSSGVPGITCVYAAGPVYVNGAIAVDEENIYWTAYGQTPAGSAVMRAPRGGGPPTVLVTGTGQLAPQCLATDGVAVYWGQWSYDVDGGSINAVALDGGAVVTLAQAASPVCIAIDDANVYWTDETTWALMRVAKTGGTPVTLAPGGHYEPGAVTVDSTSVYWVSEAVTKVGKDGGTPVTLVAIETAYTGYGSGCHQLSLIDGGFVVADARAGHLVRVGTTGPANAKVLADSGYPYAVAADSLDVVWLGNEADLQVDRVSLDGGATVILAAPLANRVPDLVRASDGTLYWTTDSQVQALTP